MLIRLYGDQEPVKDFLQTGVDALSLRIGGAGVFLSRGVARLPTLASRSVLLHLPHCVRLSYAGLKPTERGKEYTSWPSESVTTYR
jgi:hypothetical protein